MAEVVRVDVQEVVRHFQDLEDPRSPVNRLHPLESVLLIAIMAVLAGADGPTAIARWAKFKTDFLQRRLNLPHGIPTMRDGLARECVLETTTTFSFARVRD